MSKSISNPSKKNLSEDEKQFVADLVLKGNSKKNTSTSVKEHSDSSWIKKNGLLTAAIVVLSLFILSFFSNMVNFNLNIKRARLTDNDNNLKVALPKPTGLSGVDAIIFEANQNIVNKQYAAAETLLLTALKEKTSKTNKGKIYANLCALYNMNQVSEDALSACKKAEENGQANAAVYLPTAQSAEKLGNEKMAIEYYQKLVAYLDANADGIDDESEVYKKKIAELSQ